MNRPLAITERQVRAIIRAARKEGATAEVKLGSAVVRLIPDVPTEDRVPGGQPVDRKPKGYL